MRLRAERAAVAKEGRVGLFALAVREAGGQEAEELTADGPVDTPFRARAPRGVLAGSAGLA